MTELLFRFSLFAFGLNDTSKMVIFGFLMKGQTKMTKKGGVISSVISIWGGAFFADFDTY